jgi:hypothetical protein
MKYLLLAVLYVVTPALHAEEVFRIEIGRDYKKYSDLDLKRRVWELERAVWQLQQRVFQLEAGGAGGNADSWVCTITAMGDTFTGTGGSKAAATHKAVEACKAAREGDGFFCKNPKCEQ